MKVYNFRDIENELVNGWEHLLNKDVSSTTASSSTILMPPPNITGSLHLGHALNLVIQDFIARTTLLVGNKVRWISGFDHAGIATQSRIEKLGLEFKSSLEKKNFALENWYPQQKLKFIEQWKSLGLILDYQQDNFTMSDHVSERVNCFFRKLYNDQLIYRNTRIVNWDPSLQTAISDIEVESKEVKKVLYFIDYQIVDSKGNEYITVATSRPETIFADVALFINPDDKRYSKFIGSLALNPLNNKKIPILLSDDVKIEFGSGVLKCSPAHDFNDYELAKKFNLPVVSCYDKDGLLNSLAGKWKGLEARSSRLIIVNYLEKLGLLKKQVVYQGKEFFSSRSGAIIEPTVSLQWFLDLRLMVKRIEAKNKNFLSKIKFLPDSFRKKILVWKQNVGEWCISRQLWWGHQIPVWIKGQDRSKLNVNFFEKTFLNWKKETDVLDTWFSSSLWPLILNTENNLFSPIDYLVTGSDLLFFWVFKMIVFSFYFERKQPFERVLIHGLVRDIDGKKMSKSLGNGVEPEEIIEKHGADALRFFILSNTISGNDLTFDSQKLVACNSFIQKLWSVHHFISLNLEKSDFRKISWNELLVALKEEKCPFRKNLNFWIIEKLSSVEKIYFSEVSKKSFNSSLLAKEIVQLVKDFVSGTLIFLYNQNKELKKINERTSKLLSYLLQRLTLLLNPFIPFVTESIYKKITGSRIDSFLPVNYLKSKLLFNEIFVVDLTMNIRNKVSSFINDNSLSKQQLSFQVSLLDQWVASKNTISIFVSNLQRILGVSIILQDSKITDGDIVELSPFGFLRVPTIVKSAESKKKTLDFYQSEIERSSLLLANEGFVNKSPSYLVENEKKKLLNYKRLKEQLLNDEE